MQERLEFITACLDRTERIVDICARFGISEKTGHKLLQRFRTHGLAGLDDRSHARQHQPHRITPEVATRIIALRRQYPRYGAAKLHDWLRLNEPHQRWPAASSIGALLTRSGLVRPRRRPRSPEHTRLASDRTAATAPNAVWTADFKGQFHLRGGGQAPYCFPLTVLDLHTHFLLGCTGLASTAIRPTREAFVQLFRTYGLPTVIRTDNGVPFAQPNALGRLGALAFWWVRLGIRPEHIRPARPAENGAHERFHKTLKAHTTHPASRSARAQQAQFDRFRTEYNTERPHASLPNHVPPGVLYTASARPYPARLPTVGYPSDTTVRLVDGAGVIKWRTHPVFLSSNLAGQYVGLTDTDTDLVTVAYASLGLGELDPVTHRFTPHVRWLGE
jgi:putative transposase